MINSVKGRRLFGYISPIYDHAVIMQAVMEAIGSEWDDVDWLIEEVFSQLFPQTATWGIVYWERLVGIPRNDSLSIEQRRARVLTRMQTRWPMTKERMEQLVRTFSKDKQAYIRQFFNEYRFEVLFNLAQSIDLKTVNEVVSEAKPAHLDFSLVMGLRQGEKSIYVGSAMLVGEEITVYPWSVTELTGTGKVYIATGHSTGVDITTLYPKGE
jgi:hypothetical protein